AGYVLYHLSHTLQRPNIIRITVGFSSFDQLAFDLRELVSAQLRQPSRSSSPAQTVSTRSTPRRAPIRHDLMPHAQLPCDLRRTDALDRKSTRLNSSHVEISYAVFCLKKKNASQTLCREIQKAASISLD